MGVKPLASPVQPVIKNPIQADTVLTFSPPKYATKSVIITPLLCSVTICVVNLHFFTDR